MLDNELFVLGSYTFSPLGTVSSQMFSHNFAHI